MSDIRRVVVKIGTAVITDNSGHVSRDSVKNIAKQIASVRLQGVDVALVSSGAIAAGMAKLEITQRPKDVRTLQAVAAVGQGLLMQMYSELFGEKNLTVAQVLLTQSDMNHRQQYLNARHTLERLFEMGVVPIINENDTVATDEITFGDNDMLAALVASLIKADRFILLTDTEGLYTEDPRKSDDATLHKQIEVIDDDIRSIAGVAGHHLAKGGMSSKIEAAVTTTSSGIHCVIADGRQLDSIEKIISGEQVGTDILPTGKVTSRKHWIGYAKQSTGTLTVDEGAAIAIREKGRSLLAAGVVGVKGAFRVGDSVDIVDPAGDLVGRGLSNYGANEVDKIKGLSSQKAKTILGEKMEPVVHRDSLMVFKNNR